jgi:hypothetical protein
LADTGKSPNSGHLSISRQQKASWPPVLVHTLFDCQQKIGSALHLIDYCAIEAAYKGDRIASGSSQCGLVVERDVFATLLGEAAHQSGFSRLSRAADCDDSSVTQSGADLGLGDA